MTKEFVPYEQALALKELGFDEPCFMAYLNGNLDKELFLFNHSIRSHSTQEFTSAPLYQQAFRWFREKHDKLGCIKKANDRNRFVYLVNDIVFAFYDTYEDAEIACLIKLIEIVKNK